MNRRTTVALGLVVVIAVIGTAVALSRSHSSNMDMGSSAITHAVSTNKVTIQNYMFSPMAIKVKAGTTVTWTNTDQVHHSVTADTISKDAPNGPLIGQGQRYSFKFTKAGTYTFHCMPHPYMHGTVVVTN